jgi:putative spermidine/putrescine transport system ATP-binding protein
MRTFETVRVTGNASTTDARGLALHELTRRFGDKIAVDRVSLDVAEGELVALIGASGSGKTTTLRMVAGYDPPDDGRIFLNGRDITRVAPQHRGFGMVFQHYALFPHLSVEDNVGFGLEARGVGRAERRQRAREMLQTVGLREAASRAVQSLSGGEQQRVALARALIVRPSALLLDEPLSNLDPTLRKAMRHELRGMLRQIGVTALFVTHDQEDAFAVGDRVALMRNGSVLQIGTPEELYHRPASRAVAEFIGNAVVVPAREHDGRAFVLLGETEVQIDRALPEGSGALWAVLRPEAVEVVADGESNVRALVIARRFAGATTYATVRLPDDTQLDVASRDGRVHEGDHISLGIHGRAIALVRD